MDAATAIVSEKFHPDPGPPRAPDKYAHLQDILASIEALALANFDSVGIQFFNQLVTLQLNAVDTQAHTIAYQDDFGGINEENLPIALHTSEFWLEEIAVAFNDHAPGSVDAFNALHDAYVQAFVDFVYATNGVLIDTGNDPDGDAIFLGTWFDGLLDAAEAIQIPLGNGEVEPAALQAYGDEVVAIYSTLASASAAGQGNIDNALLLASFCEFEKATQAFIDDVLAGQPTTGPTIQLLSNSLADFQAKVISGFALLGDATGDFLQGGADSDYLSGMAGDDTLAGDGGDDCLNGGEGLDKALFFTSLAASTLTMGDGEITRVSGPQGMDMLSQVERAIFSDIAIAADTDIHDDGSASAGAAFGLLWAARSALGSLYTDPATRAFELGNWIARFDSGDSIAEVADQMIFAYTGGAGVSNEALVSVLYSNITGQAISQPDLDSYVGLITDGTYTQATLYQFAITLTGVQSLIESQMAGGLEYTPSGAF